MADVITRFKLETSQFDSKLRDTAKALQGIAHQASLGGKDFNNFNQKAIESARALGTVQSGANNTKDKLRDLVGSYNDAAKAYNSLTETAKKGEFGQAMSQSLTQLQQRIRETKQELYGLGDGMKGASGGSLFSSDKLSGMLQVFGGNLMTKGAGMVMSFAGELKDMVAQGIELAKAGEGVRLAFQRLGRGDILQGLREATHGTVTDLELMKAAVKFNDFKLPLDELGTMLAFAQQKAKDTGQSVDYMVDSIVTGLGRKSLMILDNLGLSAAEVKEKMKETGDMTKAVGAIIREQMAKAGDYVETAADRATQANVELENAMTRLGETFQPLTDAANSMWTDIKVGALDLLNNAIKPLIDRLTEAGRLRAQLNNINAGAGTNQTRAGKDLGYLKYEISKYGANDPRITDLYNRQRGRYIQQENQAWRQSQAAQQRYENLRKNGGSQADLNAYYQRWQTMEAQAKAWGSVLKEYDEGFKKLTSSAKVDINTDDAEQNIASLTNKLKELQAERKKAIAAGDTDKSKNLLKQINQVKADIKGLGGSTTTTTGGANGNTFDASKIVFTGGEGFKADPNTLKADPNANFLSVWAMMGGDAGLRQMMGIGKQQFDLGRDITEKDYKKLPGYKDDKETKKLTDEISTLTSGLSSIAGGLKSMGIDLPEEVDQVIGVIQGVTSVIEGVNAIISIFSTSAMSANTFALGANTAALWAVAATNFFPFANGGVVHAANGYVDGNTYSGDKIPALLNAGELVLNRAQQGNIASQLEGVGQMSNGTPYITGELIFMGLNNYLKSTGRGEMMTSRFKG